MEMVLCPKIVDWIKFGEASASKNRKGMALAKLVGGFASTYYLWGPGHVMMLGNHLVVETLDIRSRNYAFLDELHVGKLTQQHSYRKSSL